MKTILLLLCLITGSVYSQVKTIGTSAPNYDDGKIIFDTTGLNLYSWELYTLSDNPSNQTQFTYYSGGKLVFENLKPGRYWLLGKKATSTYNYDFDILVNIGIKNPKTCQGVDSTLNLINAFDPNMQQVYPNPDPNSNPMETLVTENYINYQSYEWYCISDRHVNIATGINYLYGGRPALFTYRNGTEMLYLITTDNNGCTSLGKFFNYISPMVFPSSSVVASNGGANSNNNTASINDINKEKVTVYPNPTSNSIFLKGNFTNETYKIIDTQGRIIKDGKCESNLEIQLKDNLNAGLFYLMIYDEQMQEIQKEKIVVN